VQRMPAKAADNCELRTTRLRVAFREVLNGQGEIRTLDTGFTGMPVFETGAFNHSATCPAGSQLIAARGSLQPAQSHRIGNSSFTFETIVVDGSRLGVR
jgi:hypothetical protein